MEDTRLRSRGGRGGGFISESGNVEGLLSRWFRNVSWVYLSNMCRGFTREVCRGDLNLQNMYQYKFVVCTDRIDQKPRFHQQNRKEKIFYSEKFFL